MWNNLYSISAWGNMYSIIPLGCMCGCVCLQGLIMQKNCRQHLYLGRWVSCALCTVWIFYRKHENEVLIKESERRQREKAMALHSSTLAWKIPWAEEPGRLQSMGSWRVGHDWVTSLSRFTFLQWRRKWQPTPVFLAGESQGQRSLVGCRLWGHTESDTHDHCDLAAAAATHWDHRPRVHKF